MRAQLLVGEPGHLRTAVSWRRPGKPVSSVRSPAVVEGSGCSPDTARIVDRSGATSESTGTLLLISLGWTLITGRYAPGWHEEMGFLDKRIVGDMRELRLLVTDCSLHSVTVSSPPPRIAKDRWATEAASASSARAIRDVRVAAHHARVGVAEPLLRHRQGDALVERGYGRGVPHGVLIPGLR